MSDVEKALSCHESNVVISISGKGEMKCSKLQCMRKLTHWSNLFPIDFSTVLNLLRNIIKDLYRLGEYLGAPRGILKAIETDFPTDSSRRRRELVKWWMSSSSTPPCWWQLVQALILIEEKVLAEEIRKQHGKS